jgi:RNA polymerase sigma-70 factor (ECF subfamily)
MSLSVPATATPENETDEIVGLVLRARAGDREAFGDLVERLWTELTALARGVLAADDEAEDLVQDALVHAWQRLWTLRRPESFAAWVRRIVTRRCLTRARRQKQRQEVTEETAVVEPSPSDRIDAARLLAALAPRQRAALYLTWIEGCTDQEAGRVLGLRPATVRVHRFRGLERLRRLVEERP